MGIVVPGTYFLLFSEGMMQGKSRANLSVVMDMPTPFGPLKIWSFAPLILEALVIRDNQGDTRWSDKGCELVFCLHKIFQSEEKTRVFERAFQTGNGYQAEAGRDLEQSVMCAEALKQLDFVQGNLPAVELDFLHDQTILCFRMFDTAIPLCQFLHLLPFKVRATMTMNVVEIHLLLKWMSRNLWIWTRHSYTEYPTAARRLWTFRGKRFNEPEPDDGLVRSGHPDEKKSKRMRA